MARTLLHLVVVFLSLIAIPSLFCGILYSWNSIDSLFGWWEVSRFIRDHQQLVNRRLRDPKVHSFRLTHDPKESGGLLILFDVDDKATYVMLESDLNDIWDMRFPPRWETIIRSKEKLGTSFGYVAWGLRQLGESINRVFMAAVASLALSGLVLFLALHWPRSPSAEHGPERESASMRCLPPWLCRKP